MTKLLKQVTSLQEKQHENAAVVCSKLGKNALHLRKSNAKQEQAALEQLSKTAAQRHKTWLMNAPDVKAKALAANALAARMALWAAACADKAAEEAFHAIHQKKREEKERRKSEAAARAWRESEAATIG